MVVLGARKKMTGSLFAGFSGRLAIILHRCGGFIFSSVEEREWGGSNSGFFFIVLEGWKRKEKK